MTFFYRPHFCCGNLQIRLTGVLCLLLISVCLAAQQQDTLFKQMGLDECIRYALSNQPAVQQAIIDEASTDRVIKSDLSARYPQVTGGYTIQHYVQRPAVTNPFIVKNIATGTVALTQNIFNTDVLLVARTAADTRLNAKQNTSLTRIALVVNVSKAFYDILVTREQLDILKLDVERLEKSLRDAVSQYEGGTADKTDYKRAQIALNSSITAKKRQEELMKGKIAFLKLQMGYRDSLELEIVYNNDKLDSVGMEDPAVLYSFQERVEFQQLETQRRLLEYNLKYTKWAYLPTLSFFATYNIISQDKKFSKIYSHDFPNSFFGLSLTVPILQGSRRIQATRLAQLALRRLDWDFLNLELNINSEYINALAVYKAGVSDYIVAKENLTLARDVYNTINLQYRSGVETYLDVVIAEADLRSAEVDMLNALYVVLSSKLDVQQAAGAIKY
ncbi:MAG: TolC family protein [Chitinophagaceae bacterium]